MISWFLGAGPLVVCTVLNVCIAYAQYQRGSIGLTAVFLAYSVSCVGFLWDLLK